MEKEMESFNVSGSSGIVLSDDSHLVNIARVGNDSGRVIESNETGNEPASSKQPIEKGPKKKKGKSAAESGSDNQEYVPTKSKKSQRKGKDSSSVPVSDSKPGAKKESVKIKEENLSVPSEEWVMHKIMTLVPDFEEQGLLFLTLVLFNAANQKIKFCLMLNIERMLHLFHTQF